MNKSNIKKVICLAFGILLIHSSNAQDRTINPNSELAPVSSPGASIAMSNSPNALFDIQFSFFPEDSVPTTAIAGVAFTGTELWVSRWTNNSIYRFTPTGSYIDSFTVPGVPSTQAGGGGVRAITFDGTSVWVSYNGATIKKLDPTSHTVLATFTPPPLTGGSNTTIRWITYDPTANSGAGGFWIGNFDTDIFLIKITGTVTVPVFTILNTISAGSHGLAAMYGAAFDNLSPGGPFIWVNNQGDPTGADSTASFIVQLDPVTGSLTGVQHGQDNDYIVGGAAPGGVAGGIFAGQLPGFSHPSIISVDQGVMTTAYELTVTGIKKNELANQLNIAPNPSNGLFTIVNKSKINNADVTITNAKGETVYTKHFDNFVSEKVDATYLSKGVYMVTITNEQGKSTKSMIIQ